MQPLFGRMYAPPLSTKYVTPKKQRVKSPAAPSSVDCAFHGAYHADS
jgi:hypothetical protein